MSAYLNTYVDGVRAIIAATWTDVESNGIFEDLEIADIPFDDLTKPYASFRSSLSEGEDWGSSADSFEDELEIWRFQPSATEGYDGSFDGAALRTKLEALREALETAGYIGGGQVLSVTSVNWNANLPCNAYFKVAERPFVGGVVVARMLVGEVPE